MLPHQKTTAKPNAIIDDHVQYHTSSEYLMVPCEKWYLHPTLLGKLAYNVGNSLCYINYIDGCF
jgi:hypothetical protein